MGQLVPLGSYLPKYVKFCFRIQDLWVSTSRQLLYNIELHRSFYQLRLGESRNVGCVHSRDMANFGVVVSFGLLLVALPAVAQPQSGGVRPIVQSGCRQGECWEMQVLGIRLERKTPRGQLYRIVVGRRSWPMDGKPPSQFAERSQDYVYCSRTRPAYIFRDPTGSGYLAHLLNPGGEYFGYNQHSYPVYWGVCHGIYSQDVFSPAMTRKAKQLGYPLNLPSQQITLARVTDILNR